MRQGDLRRVAHVAAARVEAEHHLQPQARAAHQLKQLPVAAPVVAPRAALHRAPLRARTARMF